jgi:hypothetical protein
MVVLHVFLLVLAMVCFLLAGFGVVPPRGGNLVAARACSAGFSVWFFN